MQENQQGVVGAFCTDQRGGLHMLLQERMYKEDKEKRQLDVIMVDIPLYQEEPKLEYHILQVIDYFNR